MRGMLRVCRMKLEELLETEWSACYRLALALVGEPAAAEDVTQEALLAAFEARERFDASRPVRPWLFGIVHRRALKHHRGRHRRAAREERVARPERTDDATTAVDEAEQAALVREHLGRIRVEYRHALALRYLEGLSLAEVSEALGIPQGTVSSQVRRGLRDLERSLSPVLGVGGSGLLALLRRALGDAAVPPAPTAEALARWGRARPSALEPSGPSAAEPAASGSPTAPSRAATAAAVAAVALLAAGLVLGLLVPGAPAGPVRQAGTPPPATTAAPPAPVTPPPPTGSPAEDASAGAASVASARPAVVRGRLRSTVPLERAWVRPVDGAELARLLGPLLDGQDEHEARRLLGREHFGWNVPAGSTPLAADGSFALDLPPGPALLALGAHGCRTRLVALEAPPAGPLDVELTWLQPSRLAAVAVDQAGLPYAGCRLRLSGFGDDPWVDGLDAWAATRPDGARLVRALRASPLEALTLDADGAASLALPAGDWTLQADLGGATRSPGSIPPFLSGSLAPAQGAVRLPPGGVGDLRAVFDWTEGAYRDHLARLDVVVVDPAGAPVAGAWVQLLEASGARGLLSGLRAHDTGGPWLVTDGRGRARLFGLAEGREYAVSARAGARWTGLDRRVRAGAAWAAGEPVPQTELVLDRAWEAGAVRLRLRDAATGQAPGSAGLVTAGAATLSFAAAWDVVLRPLSGQPEPGESGWRADSDGALLVDDVPPGRWRVRVSQPQAPRDVSWLPGEAEVEVTTGATSEVTVDLARGATLKGRVTLDGAPATGVADVTLVDGPAETIAGTASLDAAGRFAISGLVPGKRYTLVVGAREGSLPAVFREVVASDAEQPFALPSGAGLTVTVRDELGAPLRGAEVTWSVADEEGRQVTDALGRAVFRGRLPRGVTVQVLLEGHETVEREAPSDALDVTLAPAPGSVLVRGRVVDPSGAPLAGVTVSASGEPRAETDAAGRFALRLGGQAPEEGDDEEAEGQPAKREVGLLLERAGYLRDRHVVPLPAGGEEVTLTLAPGATLEGRLVAPAARLPRLAVRAHLGEAKGKGLKLDLDAAGEFRTRRAIPPGAWRLEVVDRDSGETVATHELTLVAGQAVRDLVLTVE